MQTLLANYSPVVNREYVPVAVRSGLGFRSAYGVAPVTTAPTVNAVAMAAFLNLATGFAAKVQTHRWIGDYVRCGRVVRGHWRKRSSGRLCNRIADAAIDAQCSQYDQLQGWATI